MFVNILNMLFKKYCLKFDKYFVSNNKTAIKNFKNQLMILL